MRLNLLLLPLDFLFIVQLSLTAAVRLMSSIHHVSSGRVFIVQPHTFYLIVFMLNVNCLNLVAIHLIICRKRRYILLNILIKKNIAS